MEIIEFLLPFQPPSLVAPFVVFPPFLLFLYFSSIPFFIHSFFLGKPKKCIYWAYLFFFLPAFSFFLSFYLSIFLSFLPCLSIYLFICLSIYLFICLVLSVYLSIYLSCLACLSIYLSVLPCLSLYLFICLALSVYLSIQLVMNGLRLGTYAELDRRGFIKNKEFVLKQRSKNC